MAPTLSYVALIAGVLLAVLLATISLLFSFLRGIRSRASLPYRAIPVVFPPIPVEWTPGVLLVGILTLLWGAGHVAAAISWLVIDGWSAAGKAQSQGMIIWVSVSGLLVALGGAALLARQPAGRKMMSWGFILLLLVAAIMAVMALLVPEFEEMSRKAQRQSRLLALLMTAHVLVDTALGALGQRVGRPDGFDEDAAAAEIEAAREAAQAESLATVNPWDAGSSWPMH